MVSVYLAAAMAMIAESHFDGLFTVVADDPATVEKTTRPIKELAGTDPVVLGDTGKEDSIADEPPQEPTSPRH